MARKSKRHVDESAGGGFASLYPTAIYARLSVENSGKDDDGAAIETQIDCCREYVEASDDLELYKIYEDNGRSGTNMKRPAWEEMMDDVRTGKVKAIVVRDLSRFGRNYLETGTYLERVFPKLDVRFVSVRESFDTFTTDGTAESLMVPLQNLINDIYAKDISRKIHASFKVKRENRSFKFNSVPYGYMWNEDHTGFVINEEQAGVVREVFRLYLGGMGSSRIASLLNERGVASPRKVKLGVDARWVGQSVNDMLRNPAYIGELAWGKTRKELYQNRGDRRRQSRDEWVVREDQHEPIVSVEDYEKACRMLSEKSEAYARASRENAAKRAKVPDLFKGKVFCGDCGRKIYYFCHVLHNGKAYGGYYCNSSKRLNGSECTRHNWAKSKLDPMVLRIIHDNVDIAYDFEKIINDFNSSKERKKVEGRLRRKAGAALGKLEAVQERRKRLYEDYVEGLLDADEYADVKAAFDEKAEKADVLYSAAAKELECFTESISSKNRWIRMLKKAGKSDTLTQEAVDCLIERIFLFENDVIKVEFKYQDVFEYTRDFMLKGGFWNE